MGGEDKLLYLLSGVFPPEPFMAEVEQRQRAEKFVDDGANYQNANHNVTKMEAI